MVYVYLLLAIVAEVTATTSLKFSEQFTKFIPSAIVVVGYTVAFYLLSIVLKTMQVGIAYAIWTSIGIVLVTIIGLICFKQTPDMPACIGMLLIIAGVISITLFSRTAVNH
jgi:small multidrug resistance pump